MAIYTDITNAEIEGFLMGLGKPFSKKSDTAGIFYIWCSPQVAVRLSTTLKGDGSQKTKGRGRASMKLDLVSRLDDFRLNGKAGKQSRYHRTKGWQDNWAKGIAHWEGVFNKSPDFYNTVAQRRKALQEVAVETLRNLYRNERAWRRSQGMHGDIAEIGSDLDQITSLGKIRASGASLDAHQCSWLSMYMQRAKKRGQR